MDFLQRIAAVWQNVSLVQRALLLAIILTFIIVGALLIYWVSRPDMGVLYSSLDPEEAGKIAEKIGEKGIDYKLRGTTIYAPKKEISYLRLDMAKEGLPRDSQGGYKIFDDEKIGVSPFVQNVNLKRALQEELAKSIQMIGGVVHARVHIVNTDQTLFTSQSQQTTASVVLRLRAGFRLNPVSIAAITHLVAGGVEGLKSENVTVVDSQGRLLSSKSDQSMASGAGTVADYKERVEQNLAEKVEDMLTAVLGPGRASVTVSAIIDMNSINTVTETYDPTAKVTAKEEIKSGSETGASTVPAEGQAPIPGVSKEDETILTEYKVGKTVEQRVELPGEIKSLKVAAFVDLSPADANQAGAGGAGAETAKIMPVADVEEIIKNALGLKDTAAIKVVDVPFYRPLESLAEEEESGGLDFIMSIAEKASLGIMAICALLVLKLFSGARKKAAATATAGQLPAGEGAAGLLPAGTRGSGALMLRKQIAGALRRNPDQVKQLFHSWLEEKD